MGGIERRYVSCKNNFRKFTLFSVQDIKIIKFIYYLGNKGTLNV